MIPGTPKLIIFDCDGTLVDSQYRIVAAMQGAFAAHELDAPSHSQVLSVVGLSLERAIHDLLDEEHRHLVHPVSEAYKSSFIAIREQNLHDEPLYAGARETVETLAAHEDVLLAVATGKSRRGLDKVLEREGWTNHFVSLKTADDAPSKPHPGMIEQAMAETGVESANTVMIGDTSFDMQMARAAGVTALGVAWGYHPVAHLHASGSHHVAEDFAHLVELLDELF